MAHENYVVDECPDANGHWTIRYADGSANGDTEREPIATVYNREDAENLVIVHNEWWSPC